MEILGREVLTATSTDIKNVLGKHLDSVVVCMETATGLHNISNIKLIDKVQVYSDKELSIKGVKVEKVKSFHNIDTDNVNGITCTSVIQTIKDLLDTIKDRDYSIAIETFANYYYSNGESFDTLKEVLTEGQIETLNNCMCDITEYYDME